LTFRDEYIRWLMIPLPLKSWQNCLTIEEFFKRKLLGKIRSEQFSEEERQIKFMDTAIKNHLVQ
jgi:hypothetical protein